ncbi:MAG: hypothetical protein GC154_07770 [bacterium]|nr:hypothetical protein [bacterium]
MKSTLMYSCLLLLTCVSGFAHDYTRFPMKTISGVKLVYEASIMIYSPWEDHGKFNSPFMTPEQKQEWLEKQKAPRSQVYTVVVTLNGDQYTVEHIAQAGDVYPHMQHNAFTLDLKSQNVIMRAVLPKGYERVRGVKDIPPEVVLNTFKVLGPELFGLEESLDCLQPATDKLTAKSSNRDDGEVKEFSDSTSGQVMKKAVIDKVNGHLIELNQYESPGVIRKLYFSEYINKKEHENDVNMPSLIVLQRFGGGDINAEQDWIPLEEQTFKLISVESL